MKKLTTFASAAVLAAAASQATSATYEVTGDFIVSAVVFGSVIALPFSINSGSYDNVSGNGTWNVTADLGGVGFAPITFDQDFNITAATGIGTLFTAYNCVGPGLACNGLGPEFKGSLDANGPIAVGPQVWSVTTPNFGTIDFTPTIVPVPAAAWLFGSALVGLAGIGRKRKAA